MHGSLRYRTILGLLSVLKNTARKGTVLAEVARNGAERDDVAGLESAMRSWQLSTPWLTAAPHQTCVRSLCRPSNSKPGEPPLPPVTPRPTQATACMLQMQMSGLAACVQARTRTGSGSRRGRPL